MSTVKTNNVQIGQSVTATNNGTWYQPVTPDGTIRYGIGNAGATTTDIVTLSSSGLSTPALVVSGSTAPTNGMFLPTTNTLAWSTNSTERLRLDSSGNLGLGVTPSAYAGQKSLQVANYAGGIGITASASGNDYGRIGYNFGSTTTTGSYNYLTTEYASSLKFGSGGFQFYTAPSGTAGNAISFTQAMTLDASGRLYVGTTTQASGYDMKLVLSNDSGTNNWSVGPRVAVPGAFYVAANTTYGVYLSSTTVTAWASASDERLKTDLKPIENAAQKVSTLRAVTGRFKTDEEGVSRSFLIAQDVQAVLPEAVDSEDPEKLGVRYTETIPLLVAAIKELTAELNELKQKVTA